MCVSVLGIKLCPVYLLFSHVIKEIIQCVMMLVLVCVDLWHKQPDFGLRVFVILCVHVQKQLPSKIV